MPPSLSSAQSRSIGIFVIYNTTCLLVAFRCVGIIVREWRRGQNSKPSQRDGARTRRHMRLFGVAATLSILTTWYYMINFYIHSYQEWLALGTRVRYHEDEASLVLLSSWLRDTRLFEQAWAAVVETPTRLWWSQQIFGFCAGWSVLLGLQARAHGIRGMWWFMILGQIVSISFASNLSFLAVLAARRTDSVKKSSAMRDQEPRSGRSDVFIQLVLIVTALCAAVVPFTHDQREFMPVLLVPHALGFAPLIPSLRPTSGASYLTATAMAAVLLAQTTTKVVSEGISIGDLLRVLCEHPAVSSVGWDVILCWVSYSLWYSLEG